MRSDSFQHWLTNEIQTALSRKGAEPAFVVWCDPDRVWKELLVTAAAGGIFELWADDIHELLLRERFQQTPSAPRIIWLPVARSDVTYFKVYELRAAEVITWTLPEALSMYGVDIPPDHLAELDSLLAAHAKEWFGQPRSAWRELTPGNAKGALMDDDLVLEILATPARTFDDLRADNRFSLFTRRLAEDFGLPIPGQQEPDAWRVHALSFLLCTDAAAKCPAHPPGEAKRIIAPGPQRDRALKLLSRWQKQVDLVESFEKLAPLADAQTSLHYWARSLPSGAPPLASPIAEAALFEKDVECAANILDFDKLALHLESSLSAYRSHEGGFWGRHAKNNVRWGHLARLATSAGLLLQQSGVEAHWKAPGDAVTWFVQQGWQVDQHGEILFREDAEMPGALVGVLVRIRKAYLRHLDATNMAFSELLSHSDVNALPLPFAGNAIKDAIANASPKDPVAVLVLDACRFDLGCRLADLLNQGEPSKRATVSAARAPIPSITALGMPLCLPGLSDQIRVTVEGSEWRVTAQGVPGNLAVAEQRRAWLRNTFKIKDQASKLTVSEIADATAPEAISAKTLGRLVFVFGDELDDHDCVLKPFGLDQTLERYATVIRKLRSAGYSQVLVVTDHGFYHWEPDPDEKAVPAPAGEISINSRRAIVGHQLEHASALTFKVTKSDLDVCIPRSVNCFKTYGRIGFFHGGATLQELITPVIVARWPKKAKKTGVVLKPLAQLTSLTQRVEISAASGERDLLGSVDEKLLSRQVQLKVIDPKTGRALFRVKNAAIVEPGGSTQVVELEPVRGAEAKRGAELQLQAVDADDEEILDRQTVTLQVDLDEWF